MPETFRGELPSKKEIERIQQEAEVMVTKRREGIPEILKDSTRQRYYREQSEPWSRRTVTTIKASKRKTPVERREH